MQPMAQSSREKQEAFRARMAMLGMKEVRGIFLPEHLHAALKEYAAAIEQHQESQSAAVHDAISRALDEAGVKNEVLRGMCLEVGLEKFAAAIIPQKSRKD